MERLESLAEEPAAVTVDLPLHVRRLRLQPSRKRQQLRQYLLSSSCDVEAQPKHSHRFIAKSHATHRRLRYITVSQVAQVTNC